MTVSPIIALGYNAQLGQVLALLADGTGLRWPFVPPAVAAECRPDNVGERLGDGVPCDLNYLPLRSFAKVVGQVAGTPPTTPALPVEFTASTERNRSNQERVRRARAASNAAITRGLKRPPRP